MPALPTRATPCGVALAPCTVDDEYTQADANCIAGCAEQASCEAVAEAQSGTITFAYNNAYLECADRCQCTELRNCHPPPN